MTTSPRTFATALRLFEAGAPRQAEQICRHLLMPDPAHAPALNLLGVIAHQAGQHVEAIPWIRQAISFRPDNPEFHYNLGVAQQFLGQLDEAVASSRLALRLEPDHADAHNNSSAEA